MEIEEGKGAKVAQHKRVTFSEPRESEIFFNSDFQSGNMDRVIRSSYDHYSLWTACDCQDTENQGYPKSWFYFQVGGFSNRRVTFSIHRLHFLFAMAKRPQLYRPVYRIVSQEGPLSEWERLPHPIISLGLNSEQQLVLKFDFVFSGCTMWVQFAFIYPYSHQECRRDVMDLRQKYKQDKEICLEIYELTKSYQGRVIDMLVVSSHEGRQGFQIVKSPLGDQRLARFRSNKPIIFVSARVHPIQTPSSYTMTGILQFLLDKSDLRAHLLRKYFVFVLVPMLNPDGVARGHCRMDALNQNLNRYYLNPDPARQPSCWAVKKLCEHYSRQKRLFMYLDLHAHPAYKGNFTFGNAIYEFVEQVESQLFAKVLSQNCISFEFEQCVFSRKHMKAKDRNQDISKEGCGRVVFYKEFGLVHSYTLECGYHLNSYDNTLPPPTNPNVRYLARYRLNDKGQKIYDSQRPVDPQRLSSNIQDSQNSISDQRGQDILELTSDHLDDPEDPYYKRDIAFYLPETFYNLGRNIMISVLDIWNKNPYSRVRQLNEHRKQIAQRQSKLDRFRKQQSGIKAKQKKIVELIQEQFYGQWHRRNVFTHVATLTHSKNDKKRNHTLQFQKLVSRPIKPPRTEKAIPGQQKNIDPKSNQPIFLQQKNSVITNQQRKFQNDGQSDEVGGKGQQENRSDKHPSVGTQKFQGPNYYSRNLKGRAVIRQAKGVSISKEFVGIGINKEIPGRDGVVIVGREGEMRLSKKDGLSVSSKVIKNPNFNVAHLRVRNVIANRK